MRLDLTAAPNSRRDLRRRHRKMFGHAAPCGKTSAEGYSPQRGQGEQGY